MKKSQLKKIIRETLSSKMMLNEGPACNPSNNVAGSGNVNTGGADFNSDCLGGGNLGPTQRGVCVTAPPNNMGASHHCCYNPTCLDGIGGGLPGTSDTGLDLEVDPFNPYNKFNPDPRAQAPDNKFNTMKKSQLRKIIRESIKQLMTEQTVSTFPISQIDQAVNALLQGAEIAFRVSVCATDGATTSQLSAVSANTQNDSCCREYRYPYGFTSGLVQTSYNWHNKIQDIANIAFDNPGTYDATGVVSPSSNLKPSLYNNLGWCSQYCHMDPTSGNCTQSQTPVSNPSSITTTKFSAQGQNLPDIQPSAKMAKPDDIQMRMQKLADIKRRE